MSLIYNETDLNSAINAGGSYTLANNVYTSTDLNQFPSNISFELDGANFTIVGTSYNKLLRTGTSDNVQLNIRNLTLLYGSNFDGSGGGIGLGLSRSIGKNISLYMENVVIDRCYAWELGGGLFVNSNNGYTSAVCAVNCSIINCKAGFDGFNQNSNGHSGTNPSLWDTSCGGGVWISLSDPNASANFVNCTVSTNSARSGGGIQINICGRTIGGDNADVLWRNCTVYENSGAVAYGGIYAENTLILRNTIVSNNRVAGNKNVSGSDLGGNPRLIDIEYSLLGNTNFLITPYDSLTSYAVSSHNTTDGKWYYGNKDNADAGLLPISALNGTFVYPLATSSIAIDSGDIASSAISIYPMTDQRGSSRIHGIAIDIGSYEYNPPTPTPYITLLNPSIALSGQTNISINGTGFFGTGSTTKLLINNNNYTSAVTNSSDIGLNFTVPSLPEGAYAVTLSSNVGIGNSLILSIVTPTITSLTPLYTTSGSVVTLEGKNFTTNASLIISGTNIGVINYSSNITYNSNNEITFIVPEINPSPYSYNVFVSAIGNISNYATMNIIPSNNMFSGPVIKFSNQNPSDRLITSGITVPTGSVHVTVFDNGTYGSLTASSAHFVLLDGSIGQIDNSSFVQTTSAMVDFDIINISAFGNVILSAKDNYMMTSTEIDGPWYYTCPGEKQINLVNFLPEHLYNSDVYGFTKFFEDFLNTMYEDLDDNCNNSILRKIEKLRDFNDPLAIDLDYINFFAKKLGYNVNLSRGELGLFITSGNTSYENLTGIELENANKYLRLVVSNLPNWYKIKTTRNAVKIMLYSFGIIGEITTLFSNDYQNNWIGDSEYDNINLINDVPIDYYPSPHFSISVDLEQTKMSWSNNISEVVAAIDSIRPVNTVFDKIRGFYKMDRFTSQVLYGNINKSYHLYIPWSGSPATL